MQTLTQVAPAFMAMAHNIVWASAATVDKEGRPHTRILHPVWEWDGQQLVGWVGTGPTKTKRSHLEAHPYMSLNYWAPSQDTCTADCHARLAFDIETRARIWNLFKTTPPPLGYDPAMIPVWNQPSDDAFAVLELRPYRLRVFPGTVLMGQGGEVLLYRGDTTV